MLARVATDVTGYGNALYVVVLGGSNDVLMAILTIAQIEANLQAIYSAVHNSGAKVVAVTIPPNKGHTSWTTGTQTVLDAVNAWILTSATDVDYRIDAYTALEDPGVADTMLATYDSGDHLHPSAAGYVVLGAAIYSGTTWTGGYGSTEGFIDLPITTSWRNGVIMQDNWSLLHTYTPSASYSTTTIRNIFLGHAGNFTLTGSGASNIGIGNYALSRITSGTTNVAMGQASSSYLTTGTGNVSVGHGSLIFNSQAHGNVAVGGDTLSSYSAGNIWGGMVVVGYNAGTGATTKTHPLQTLRAF